MKYPRFEPAGPFSGSDLDRIEEILGRELPADYRRFAAKFGGAFVGGMVTGKQEVSILTFFQAGGEHGVITNLEFHSDLRAEGILPFADCELGNLHVLDRDGAVYYISYDGGRTTALRTADSFQEFLDRIVIPEE